MRQLILVVFLVGSAVAAPQYTPTHQNSKSIFLGDSSYSSVKNSAHSSAHDLSFQSKPTKTISAHVPDPAVHRPLIYDIFIVPLGSAHISQGHNDLDQQATALVKTYTVSKSLHNKVRRDVPVATYSHTIVKDPQDVKPITIKASNSTETTPVARVRRDVPLSSFTRTGEGEQVALPGMEQEEDKSGVEEVQTTFSPDQSSLNNSTADNSISTEITLSQSEQEQEIKVQEVEDNVSSEAPESPLHITKWLADTTGFKPPSIKPINLPKFPSFFNG